MDMYDAFFKAMLAQIQAKETKDKTGVRLEFVFNSIEDFYESAVTIDPERADRRRFYDHMTFDSLTDHWVGLSLDNIKKYKYGYTPGINKLEEMKEDLHIVGASSFQTKWDTLDGEEMSMDRFYDERPFLSKRVRKHGFLNGKFIKIYVNIDEHCGISYEEMLNKTYTVVSIIDYLESMGYRTEVFAICQSLDLGTRDGNYISETYIEVPIKQMDAILNISLLLTTLSPWFFRYWCLLLYLANAKTFEGMGRPARIPQSSKIGELRIGTEQCLDEESSQTFIMNIKRMYDQELKD